MVKALFKYYLLAKKPVLCMIVYLLLWAPFRGWAQEIPASTEQQLENQAEAEQGETEDDLYLQELEQFRKNPVNINTADAGELKQLRILTDLQIENLLSYRALLGKLVSLYELQAVPAWDIGTIKKILPFVTTALPVSLKEETRRRFRNGEQYLLLRIAQVVEKAAGFDPTRPGAKYTGSPQRILLRYRYNYKNLLQFGLVGDKDAGEQFFKGVQQKGFDFYSFHLFARKIGPVQAIALGDFTVNMGQGLIQWQGLAFKKSVEVMGVKRQSAVLRPYFSAGEFNFHRGAGITVKMGKIEYTAFFSFRKIGGNRVADTVYQQDVISSILTSGYHRTVAELEDRNNLAQTAFGGTVTWRGKGWQAGWNGIHYSYSLPIKKRNEPYNLYAISGKDWYNMSIDYSYTYKNIHFFGEAAVDKRSAFAFVNGLLVSMDPRVDVSVVQRTISNSYQSINGNAFTENTAPSNETGFFAGVTIRPAGGWRVDAYGDCFQFPWLKYGVDAPSRGSDYLFQLTYTPNKQVELYSRFRNETKQANHSENNTITHFLVPVRKQNWRTHLSYKVSPSTTLRYRIELIWYDNKERPDEPFGNGKNKSTGFLSFFDVLYKPLLKPFAAVLRFQYFETDDYNARVYAYENDVLYSYSIPAFYDKGYRYYLNLNYDWSRKLSFWVRWAQTIYQNKVTIGSGTDEIRGNRRSEIRIQARLVF